MEVRYCQTDFVEIWYEDRFDLAKDIGYFLMQKMVEGFEIGMKVCLEVRYCQTNFDEIWYENGPILGKNHLITFD